MILATLRDYFLSHSAVSNLIGDRLFPHVIEQGVTMPAADMRTVGATPSNFISGWTKHTKGRVVIDCYSDTSPDAAFAVAKAMRDCGILGFRGATGTSPNRYFIHGVDLDDDITYDTEGVEPGSANYRHVMTFALSIDYGPLA